MENPISLPANVKPLTPEVRKIFSGTLLLNNGFDRDSAEKVISSELADAVSFGTLFISNPDLPMRFAKENAILAKADHATYYGGAEKGYTDYPVLE